MSMKKNRKLLSILIILVLVFTMVIGCAEQTGNNNQGTTGPEPIAEEPIELSYWVALNPNAAQVITSLNDVTMYKTREEMSGAKIKFEHPSVGSEDEQFNLMIVSNDLPDIIENLTTYPGGPNQAIEDGVIIPLNDLIKEHATNLQKILDENPEYAKEIKTDEGVIYAIPALLDKTYRSTAGPMIRKDLLDKYKLDVPETVDEWEHAMRTLKNEENMEAPFTGLLNWPHIFAWAYGIQVTEDGGFYQANDKVKFGPAQPEYKEYLTRMNAWYEEGLLDPDYFTLDRKTFDAKVLQNKALGWFGFIGGILGKLQLAGEEANPEFKLTPTQYPVLNKGDEPKFIRAASIYAPHASAYITSSNEHPEETVKWFDYWFSEEGQMLQSFGVEGVTYTSENGYPKYTDEIMNNSEGLAMANALGKHTRASYGAPGMNNDPRYLEQYYELEQQKDAVRIYGQYADNDTTYSMPSGLTPTVEESKEIAKLSSDINTYVSEMLNKFIMGAESLDKFDDYIKRLEDFGIERLIELKQSQLDRYNAR